MIYIMYPNCMPDIMILAQVVLQVFCSQGCFTTQNAKVGNVNQVIYTLDIICERNIMILAQTVLELFCSHGSIGLQWQSRKTIEKGAQLCNEVRRKRKKYGSSYFSYLFHISNFKLLSLTVLDRTQSVTHARTDRPKPICPPQILRSWGHKNLT